MSASSYYSSVDPNAPPFDPSFMFTKINTEDPMEDEDTEKVNEQQNKKREKHTKNKDKKKIINRSEGVLKECPLCGNPILKKGEEGNNESFKLQLMVINDEETGVEQYVCGLCGRFLTLVINKSRIKVTPNFTMTGE